MDTVTVTCDIRLQYLEPTAAILCRSGIWVAGWYFYGGMPLTNRTRSVECGHYLKREVVFKKTSATVYYQFVLIIRYNTMTVVQYSTIIPIINLIIYRISSKNLINSWDKFSYN